MSALSPKWEVDKSPGPSTDSRELGNGRYVSAQTQIAYSYSAYRMVLFIDLDDSMLSVSSDGSISFDSLADRLSALMEVLRETSTCQGVPMHLTICIQHIANSAAKTLFEGLLTTFAKSTTPGQIKKLLFRHLSQPGSVAGTDVSKMAAPLGSVLEYSLSHLQLLPSDACPIILLVTSGQRQADIRANTTVLCAARTSLFVLVVHCHLSQVRDIFPLDEITSCSGGAIFDLKSDLAAMSERLMRPMYYKALSTVRKHEDANRPELCSYELDGIMLQHLVAIRLMDGFKLIGTFCEAGKYLDSSSSERRLAYQYTFRFEMKLGKRTSVIYEATCLIFQKAHPATAHRQKNARTTFRASRGRYMPTVVKIYNAPLPDEWSAATISQRIAQLAHTAAEFEERDRILSNTMCSFIKLLSSECKEFRGYHEEGEAQNLAHQSLDVNSQTRLNADCLKKVLNRGYIISQLQSLIPTVEKISALDTLCLTRFYIRGLDLLTDLSRNSKFHDVVITKILSCFGADCTPYEYSTLRWILVGPPRVNYGLVESIADEARLCPDMIVVAIYHFNGVFMELKVSRLRVGTPRKTFYFNKDTGVGAMPVAVLDALQAIGFNAHIINRDLHTLYCLTSQKCSVFRAIRSGKMLTRCVEYSLDFSDPLMFSSIVNELSVAKLMTGFQICSNTTDSLTGTVVMHFSAAVAAVLSDDTVHTLVQCHIVCRSQGIVINYLSEQEFSQFMQQKSYKKLSTLVSLYSEQDESIMKLYGALISIFNQYRQRSSRRVSISNTGMKLTLSKSQWCLITKNSDVIEYLLPSFRVFDDLSANKDLALLLSTALVDFDSFVLTSLDDISSEAHPQLICKQMDAESILFIEILPSAVRGEINISTSENGDSFHLRHFSAYYESCLKIQFRLLKLPMLRPFITPDLQSYATFFGLISDNLESGINVAIPKACSFNADLPSLKMVPEDNNSATPVLPPTLSRRASSGRIAKLLTTVRDSTLRFHLHNFAVFLYSKIRLYGYVPLDVELSTALHNCRVVTHELDISTLCAAKRSALKMCDKSKTLNTTIEAFKTSIGRVLMPIPMSEYFVYVPNPPNPLVPMFVKFDYVLVSLSASAPLSENADRLAEDEGMLDHFVELSDCSASGVSTKDGNKNDVNKRTDMISDMECLLLDENNDRSARFASGEHIAQCLVNLSEGMSPNGAVISDVSDYIMRVQFFLPQCQGQLSNPHCNSESCADVASLSRTSYADFSSATSMLTSELDTFLAMDILESLALENSPTPETLVLAQHCLTLIPAVTVKSISLDVVSPSSLSNRNLPDVATNKILRFLDTEIQSILKASKIGTAILKYFICFSANRFFRRRILCSALASETRGCKSRAH